MGEERVFRYESWSRDPRPPKPTIRREDGDFAARWLYGDTSTQPAAPNYENIRDEFHVIRRRADTNLEDPNGIPSQVANFETTMGSTMSQREKGLAQLAAKAANGRPPRFRRDPSQDDSAPANTSKPPSQGDYTHPRASVEHVQRPSFNSQRPGEYPERELGAGAGLSVDVMGEGDTEYQKAQDSYLDRETNKWRTAIGAKRLAREMSRTRGRSVT